MSDEECVHNWTQERVFYDEVEQHCFRCGSTRKGHIAWGDWEREQ